LENAVDLILDSKSRLNGLNFVSHGCDFLSLQIVLSK